MSLGELEMLLQMGHWDQSEAGPARGSRRKSLESLSELVHLLDRAPAPKQLPPSISGMPPDEELDDDVLAVCGATLLLVGAILLLLAGAPTLSERLLLLLLNPESFSMAVLGPARGEGGLARGEVGLARGELGPARGEGAIGLPNPERGVLRPERGVLRPERGELGAERLVGVPLAIVDLSFGELLIFGGGASFVYGVITIFKKCSFRFGKGHRIVMEAPLFALGAPLWVGPTLLAGAPAVFFLVGFLFFVVVPFADRPGFLLGPPLLFLLPGLLFTGPLVAGLFSQALITILK